jgi:hypothetical protein
MKGKKMTTATATVVELTDYELITVPNIDSLIHSATLTAPEGKCFLGHRTVKVYGRSFEQMNEDAVAIIAGHLKTYAPHLANGFIN